MSIRTFYKRYEHHINALAFIGGFIFDMLALQRIDHLLSQVLLTLWLGSAGAAIVFHSVVYREMARATFFGKIIDWVSAVLPFFIQFALGAILSGSLVFFSRSASLAISWPFLVLIVLFIVGNEVFRSRYVSLAFQVVAFYVAAFLYATLFIPLLIKSVGPEAFVVSGVVSFVLFLFMLWSLRTVARARYKESRILMWVGMVLFTLVFSGLYFKNMIPPLPLFLEEIGIYHSVTRDDLGNYTMTYEPAPRFSLSAVNATYHLGNSGVAYAFSSVFAPQGIRTTIVHEWSRYDTSSDRYVVLHRISFPLVGGREGGYRGYSVKQSISEGKWRVDVMTDSGKLIGRTNFVVVAGAPPTPLETRIQ